jgi:hypothetical protein
MAYTLTLNDKTIIDLGKVQSTPFDQDSQLEHVTFPLCPAENAAVFDFNGVRMAFTLKGVVSFATATEAWDWIANMFAIQDGNQYTIVYHDDGWDYSTVGNHQDGKFNVKVSKFMVNPDVNFTPGLNVVQYTLLLLVGDPSI